MNTTHDSDEEKPGFESAQKATGNSGSTILQVGHDLLGDIRITHAASGEPTRAVSVTPPLGRRIPARPLRGRSGLLTELADLLPQSVGASSETRVRVLHGLGGCGKTSIALELSQQAYDTGMDVWWVPATDSAVLIASMHAVARRVGASDEELRYGDAADVLWRRLEAHPRPWLLVVDNADDLDMLGPQQGQLADGRGWVRPHASDRGLVVVTTRDGDPAIWGAWCVRHQISGLDVAAAAMVLLDHTGDRAGTTTEAAALASRMDCLPLALRLAGAYLADTALIPWPSSGTITNFTDYKAALDLGRLDLFDDDSGTSVIGRAWEMSLDLLERRRLGDARPLLRLISYLADAPVPYMHILQPDILAQTSLFPDLEGAILWRLLQALANLGLIELTTPERKIGNSIEKPPLLRVHSLVRDASRHYLRLASGQAAIYLEAAALLLSAACTTEVIRQPAIQPLPARAFLCRSGRLRDHDG